MRFLALALCAPTLCAAPAFARPAKALDFIALRAGPGAHFAATLDIPAHALVEVGRCGAAWCRVAFAGEEGYVLKRALAFVATRAVEEPMLPPLGAYVWVHADPTLYDPHESAGPWYTGPWLREGTTAVEWRYGFPGGHVPWHRNLGWRPGFGLY